MKINKSALKNKLHSLCFASVIKPFLFEPLNKETLQSIKDKIIQFLYKKEIFNDYDNPIVSGVNFFFETNLLKKEFYLKILPEVDTEISYVIQVENNNKE